MKCSLVISNFLEETSSLSHSIVFLYFFALITKEGFLISPCYSLELCIQMGVSFLFCESWTTKKAECRRIDAFELWFWRRLYTWTSPDGQHRNQIDYILCSPRWRSSIQSTKTRPGADCGSDHELLIAKFRLKLKKVGKPLDLSGMT